MSPPGRPACVLAKSSSRHEPDGAKISQDRGQRCPTHSYRPPPHTAAVTTGPRLPTRRRAPPASAPKITSGRVAGVLIGVARVCKAFGGELFAGVVTSYRFPFFRVRYTDGYRRRRGGPDGHGIGARPGLHEGRLTRPARLALRLQRAQPYRHPLLHEGHPQALRRVRRRPPGGAAPDGQ